MLPTKEGHPVGVPLFCERTMMNDAVMRLALRPATEADLEFSFPLRKAAMGEYITAGVGLGRS